MGIAGGMEDMKATGATAWVGRVGTANAWEGGSEVGKAWVEGLGKAGGLGVRNGWDGGVETSCGARTDLATSSSQRSASDGVRRWEW